MDNPIFTIKCERSVNFYVSVFQKAILVLFWGVVIIATVFFHDPPLYPVLLLFILLFMDLKDLSQLLRFKQIDVYNDTIVINNEKYELNKVLLEFTLRGTSFSGYFPFYADKIFFSYKGRKIYEFIYSTFFGFVTNFNYERLQKSIMRMDRVAKIPEMVLNPEALKERNKSSHIVTLILFLHFLPFFIILWFWMQ